VNPTSKRFWSRLDLLLPLLLVAALLLWLGTTRFPLIREHRLFLLEDRQSADLSWHEVSGRWTEAEVQRRFAGYPIHCGVDHTGSSGIDRSCWVDLKRLNGVPTMYVNFLFAGGKLHRVATAIPAWSHAAGMKALTDAYGPPLVTQDRPVSGLRLHGWELPGGATVFYNRHPDETEPRKRRRLVDLLDTHSTQWMAESACAPRPSCLR